MNKLTKAIILGTAAIATVASTIEFASARDRYPYWRNHHGRFYHNRAVAAGVLGVTAGVLVGTALAQPRVVYRERPLYRPAPVVVEEETPVYADPDAIYAEPEAEYMGPVDEYAQPGDEDYVRPRRQDDARARDNRRMDDNQMDDQAQDENYFPDRPQRHKRQDDVAQGGLEPWTAEWRSYCKQRFASFNATTGTYTGYDGKSHFCTAG